MVLTENRLARLAKDFYPYLAVTVISIATLALELAQNRILSFQYWHHVVYFIITTALLGMAAGGSIYYYSRRLQNIPVNTLCRACLFLFSVSMIVSTLIVSTVQIGFGGGVIFDEIKTVIQAFLTYSVIITPYVFFGICLSAVFQKLKEQSGRLYFFNLFGSAVGCVAFVVLIEPLGMELFLILLAALCAAPAAFGAVGIRVGGSPAALRRLLGPVLFLASIGAFVLVFAPTADRAKQFNTWFPENDRVVETTVWHPIARLDVLRRRDGASAKVIVYDGDAQTTMRPAALSDPPGDLVTATLKPGEEPLRDAPYLLFPERPPGRVAVIGSGGGEDVTTALRWGAGPVDAVEINGATNRLVTGRYDDYLGGLFNREDVRLYTEDGRAFISRTNDRYDRIVLYAIDSFAASSSGAYIFSEAYL